MFRRLIPTITELYKKNFSVKLQDFFITKTPAFNCYHWSRINNNSVLPSAVNKC